MAKTATAEKIDPQGEKSLTIPESAGLPANPEDITGYEDIDPSAFIIPRLKIVQPTSKEGTAGTFLMNLTQEEFTQIPVVVVKAARSRVMWDKDNPQAEKPLCRSFDFFSPDCSSLDGEPMSPVCAETVTKNGRRFVNDVCPKAKWGEGKDARPECGEVWNLLCVTDEGIPFWLNCSGASIKPVKSFISSIALRRKNLSDFQTVLSLVERKEPHKHYVLKFDPPKPLTDEMADIVKPVAEGIKTETVESSIKAEESAQAAASGSGDSQNGDAAMPDWMDAGSPGITN